MAVRPILAYSRPDLAAEPHHRIANSLSMIAGLARLQASSLASGPAMEAQQVRLVLEELGGRVDTVARLHRLLSDAPADDSVDLVEYLKDIAGGVDAALSAKGVVELRFGCDAVCRVPAHNAIPLGLIVVELVTNAVKYSHPAGTPGTIELTCRRLSDETIVVEVSDDGVGLPEGFDPMQDGRLGLRLVRMLAAQLAARLSFDSNPLGLSCQLRLLMKKAA